MHVSLHAAIHVGDHALNSSFDGHGNADAANTADCLHNTDNAGVAGSPHW